MSKNICYACGTKINKDAKQCPTCGLTVSDINSELDEIDIVDTDDDVFICDNCGIEVSAEDTVCPGCGLTFEEDDDEIKFVSNTLRHINNYLDEIECEYDKTLNNKFIGLKISEVDKYYVMYFSYKDNNLILTYRTDVESSNKYELDITNMNYEDVLKIIDIIMNFNSEIYE